MELLVELRFPAGATQRRADVRLDVDPDDTVAALTEALGSYAARGGYVSGRSGTALVRGDGAEPLAPAARIADTGLVSGEVITLTDGAAWDIIPPPPPPPGAPPMPAPAPGQITPQNPRQASQGTGLTLDITAGPEAGRVIPLWYGDIIVGRAATSGVVVDDPLLSRQHFALHVNSNGEVWVAANPAATNGTVVGGVELGEARALAIGETIQAGTSMLVVREVAGDETRRRDRMGQVPFNRVPYHRAVVQPQRLPPVPAPPSLTGNTKLSIATAMTPLGGGVMMAVLMNRPQMMLMGLASPVMLIYRHFSNKRGGKKKFRKEKAEYYERVDTAAEQLDLALEVERNARLAAAPDLASMARQAGHHMPRLWERNRVAGDLLELRLGLGEARSQVEITIANGGDDELRAEGEARLAHQGLLRDVPISVNLLELGVLGLWGDPMQVAATGRALIAQAACLHSPEDVVMVAALGPTSVPGSEWLKWLPHIGSATSPLEGDHLAIGPEATARVLVKLLTVASDRNDRASSGGVPVWPKVLLLLDEATEVDRALLAQLLDVGPAFGIHVLWLGTSELQVPRQCQAVLECPGMGRLGNLRFTDPTVADCTVELDGADAATARSIARSLSPLRDASAASQTTTIPRLVSLLDAVGIDKPTADVISQRWAKTRPYGLEFVLGMSADGPFALDLVEQGPHTLIGGTSGAGKSELLQTLVLSLAANYSPQKLNFLFVDYKGGASSAEFRDLPHTVGYVTNLSGRMSLRALTSLRAELQRRMQLMEGKAKDLAEMLVVAPDEAPPSLIIVVDEFAALVKEIPDFVAGIVDIAQRGRSLGVHLILATQRPTGVVNDNILANTNLRISLRMLDPTDSMNIIGSRDAADIPVPLRGRAYARTGPQALVPFQTAWSGAPFAAGTTVRAIDVEPFALPGTLGAPTTAAAPSLTADEAEPETHLEVLVQACAEAATALALPPVRRPWVEPLGEVIPLDHVLYRMDSAALAADPGRIVALGMYDDPANQAQHVASVDLEATGGLMAFGTGGSGKTTLLRTVALGLVRQGPPEAVQIYVLDFASRGLDQLADLPHCAAVVPGDDVEQTTRLLTLLESELDSRRTALADARAENLGALRAQTGRFAYPRIVVLLDSYSGFHGTFDRADRYPWQQALQRIVAQGRQVGIHFVMTTDRRMGVPNALLSAISARIALRMATPDELASLGVPTKLAKDAELPNGRGYLDGTVEVQIACVSPDPAGVVQADAIAAAAEQLQAQGLTTATGLPELPESFTFETPSTQPLTAPFGRTDLTLQLTEVDLRRQNLVVMGPPLSGKSTALETVAWGVRAATDPEIKLFALGSASSPLADLDVWDDAAFSRAGHAALVTRLGEAIGDDEGIETKAMLFIDAAEDVEGNDVVRPLEALTKRDSLRLVVACEATTINKAYSGWLSPLRRNRSAVLLQPESKGDAEASLGVKPSLRPDQTFPPGRGIFVANRRWSLIQVGLRPITPRET